MLSGSLRHEMCWEDDGGMERLVQARLKVMSFLSFLIRYMHSVTGSCHSSACNTITFHRI